MNAIKVGEILDSKRRELRLIDLFLWCITNGIKKAATEVAAVLKINT